MNNDKKTVKITEGEGAPLNAPNAEDQPDMTLEEQGFKIMDEERCEEANNASRASDDEEKNADDTPEGEAAPEGTNPSVDKPKDESAGKEKPRFSGAARKRFRYFLQLGMTPDEARERADMPVGPTKPDKTPPDEKKPKVEEPQGIKVCLVPESFPEETLTAEQSKSIQEAIMDQILEMGNSSTVKPKFNHSAHQEGWLAIRCADQPTVDWLKDVTPTIKPWEGASLQALEDQEMPHPETFLGFLPDSQEYSDDKILKLLEAQNDKFNVSTWTIIRRENVGSELEVSFSIDRKHNEELRKAGCTVSYKFGQVQLWPKTQKRAAESEDSKDSKSESAKKRSRAKAKSKGPRGGSPARGSNWRGSSKSYSGGSSWRGGQQNRGGGSKSYKGAPYSRSNRNRPNPWDNYSHHKDQNISWYADPWNK